MYLGSDSWWKDCLARNRQCRRMKTKAENKRRMIEKRENIPDDDNECERLAGWLVSTTCWWKTSHCKCDLLFVTVADISLLFIYDDADCCIHPPCSVIVYMPIEWRQCCHPRMTNKQIRTWDYYFFPFFFGSFVFWHSSDYVSWSSGWLPGPPFGRLLLSFFSPLARDGQINSIDSDESIPQIRQL